MLKAAVILAASAAALGLTTLALAQGGNPEIYYSVNGNEGPWYLQRSSCTLAHNDSENAPNERDRGVRVVWFRTGMGTDVEFGDRRLRDVRVGEATLTASVDGVAQEVYGAQGVDYGDGRPGYRLFGSHDLLDAIAAGRRLEIRRGGRPLLELDLAGAGPAIAALRECWSDSARNPPEDMNMVDAMGDAAEGLGNETAPEEMSSPNRM